MPGKNLIDLPQELFLKNMTLDHKTIKSLTMTCTFFSFLRNNAQGKGGAYLLMDKVDNFDLKGAKRLAEKNTEWIFEQIKYTFDDGVFTLSPLQRSFKLRDSYMWKMFLKIIETNPEHLKKFEEQMKLEQNSFDIKPLLISYDNYLTIYKEICQKEKISKMDEEEKNNILIVPCGKIGIEQSKLPKHMLYEMFRLGVLAYQSTSAVDNTEFTLEDCSKIRTWVERQFNADTNKPPLRKFICCFEGEGITKDFDLITLLKKGSATAVRGDYELGAWIVEWAGTLLNDDKLAFEALYQQRESEFTQQLLSFKCTSHSKEELPDITPNNN